MVKSSASKSSGTSRVRFIMVDAEIANGDITSVTQAISNALRGPTPAVVKRIAAASASMNDNAEHEEPEYVEEAAEEVDTTDVTPQTPRQRTSRKPAPKPNVVDIDIITEPSLASYAAKTNPKSHRKRYLIIAAWLHDCRKIEAVTVDHIYTCYRHLNWPTNIADFAQPLRMLKHHRYFTTPEAGKYAINQLGLAKAAEAADD